MQERETCPKCKPLRKEAVPKTKTARCYTPAFPYQRHCGGYVEMSEEDAALFWDVGIDSTLDPKCVNVDLTLSTRAAPIAEEATPKKEIPIRPVPSCEPDDPRRTDACANPMEDSQDSKPVESAHMARMQDREEAFTDDTSPSRPPPPQATTGTQTNEMKKSRIETLLENEPTAISKEKTIPGPDQPQDSRTQHKGWRRAVRETPDGPEPEFEDNLWVTLPFTEATWRPTYGVRAVTSAKDVDPRVQEVLDLPVLDLAAAQNDDPDLVVVK